MTESVSSDLSKIAVVIGMPRAATTWLYENINRHPGVCVSDRKEINRYLTSMSEDAYLANFAFDAAHQVGLDISPAYYLSDDALRRIQSAGHKVILLVREKSEWVESLRKQLRKQGLVEESGIYRIHIGHGDHLSFDSNKYDQQSRLDFVRRLFDNILIVEYKDVDRDPVALLGNIERFLGLESYFSEGNIIRVRVNSGDARISSLYLSLLRLPYSDFLARVALAVFSRRIIHWARRRFVYGYGLDRKNTT